MDMSKPAPVKEFNKQASDSYFGNRLAKTITKNIEQKKQRIENNIIQQESQALLL